jgi:hypothetical protein
VAVRRSTETERRDADGFRYWSARDVSREARRSGLNAYTEDPVRGPIVFWLPTLDGPTKRWTFVDSTSALNFVRGWQAACDLA